VGIVVRCWRFGIDRDVRRLWLMVEREEFGGVGKELGVRSGMDWQHRCGRTELVRGCDMEKRDQCCGGNDF
jgi:hypothetical protein